ETEGIALPSGFPTPAKTWTLHVGESFADVPTSNIFYSYVENIFHNGVTGGCGGTNYCPTNQTLRKQMAVFVLKSKLGSSYAPPACVCTFSDVPCPGTFTDWIEDLSNRGIAAGCGGGNFCPTNPTTRGQMAPFLSKTFGLLLYGP